MAAGFEFHATAAELVRFALDMSSKHKLFVTAIHRDESSTIVLIEPGAGATPITGDMLRWLCMTASSPNLKGVTQDFDFLDNNADRLSIILGEQKGLALRPSMLQYPTGKQEAKLWRRVASSLKKQLHRGGWLYWPSVNAKRQDSSRLFSTGAVELHDRGGELRGTGRDLIHIPGMESNDPRLANATEG